jgi:RNA polymerase sigma-70 factor (ECF subfamily)
MRALGVLYRGMRVQVFAVALAVIGDRGTAEDVMQDTFVRVYSAAPGYRPESRGRAWVLTIARHLAMDAVRRRTREPVCRMAGRGAAAQGGEPDGIRLDVVNALLQLGQIDRQIVVLHDLAGLTHAEVAAELGLPGGTVRWRYRVALARLQRIRPRSARALRGGRGRVASHHRLAGGARHGRAHDLAEGDARRDRGETRSGRR